MTLLTSLKDYAKRHRRGLVITATLAGGSYLAGRYATSKLKEYQEKSTSERLAKENLKRRFQQNQNDCVFTVLSLLPTLGDQILYEMNVEASWAKLQESRKLEKLVEKRKQEQAARKQQRREEKTLTRLRAAELKSLAEQQQKEEKEDKKDEEKAERAQDGQEEQQKDENEQGREDSADASKATLDMSLGSISDSIHTTETGASSMVVVDEHQQQQEEEDDGSEDEDEDDTIPEGLLDKKAKYLLWEDIKTTSFTRTLTTMYSVTLLTVLTHIQLNLLGRFTYVWSVSILNKSEPSIRLQHQEEEENRFLDPQTERMFLSVSWWLLHRGWRKCAERVKEAVDDIVGNIPLKSVLNYQDTEELVSKLRKRIEYEDDGHTPISFRSWMLPDTHEEELEFLRETGFSVTDTTSTNSKNVTLRQLLDETKDFIDSPDFITVFSSCLEEVYSIFDHQALGKTLLPSPIQMEPRIQEITEEHEQETKKMTLANLLPGISRQAHLVIAGNEYLNGFTYLKELQAFSAMIYTQYGPEVKASSF